jgi:alpha-glucosidase (family GH31 glycosyl hydrolase)
LYFILFYFILFSLYTAAVAAQWQDLQSSIVSIMDFNLFSVPMIGADICGFIYSTTEELCARWIEVGAFYPFSRNHNAIGEAPQELYLWDSVAEASRNALGMRYQLLPYLYTLFYFSHDEGKTVINSLWYTFPTDTNALSVTQQFMWGNKLLISPVTTQGATSVQAYFPQQYWYNFQTHILEVDASEGGLYKTLETPLTSVNVHVKGGSILPLQEAALTTTAGRQTPFTLLATLCPNNMARGDLFWDDGEQIDLDSYLLVSYQLNVTPATGGLFVSTISHDNYSEASKLNVQTIQILGNNLQQPSKVSLNNQEVSLTKVVFDKETGSLTFSSLPLKLNDAISLSWSY